MFLLPFLLVIPAVLSAESTTSTIYSTTASTSSKAPTTSSLPSTSFYVEARSEAVSEEELPLTETTVLPNLEISATSLVEEDTPRMNTGYKVGSSFQFCRKCESRCAEPCHITKVSDETETEACLCNYQIKDTLTASISSETSNIFDSMEKLKQTEEPKATNTNEASCSSAKNSESDSEYITSVVSCNYATTISIDTPETEKVAETPENAKKIEEAEATTGHQKPEGLYDLSHAPRFNCEYASNTDDIKTPEAEDSAAPRRCKPCPYPISSSDLKDTGNSRTVKCKPRQETKPVPKDQVKLTTTVCGTSTSINEPTYSTKSSTNYAQTKEKGPKTVETPQIPEPKFKPSVMCREFITSAHINIESGCIHIPAGTEDKLLPGVTKGDYITTRKLLNKLLEIFASTSNKDIDTSNYKDKFVDMALDLMSEPDFESRWLIQ